ncbi:unnamed protein product [Allacma fusca]|uniref:Phospholipid/glycerol acyltransferase domain-containing protein n=1 Tax=Allacma fusca TaxID=39272 RepID=A0A8J2P5H7_9HEXA|nr:unnamed protein product [Allacma fusca]
MSFSECPACMGILILRDDEANLVNEEDSGVKNCFDFATNKPENPWYVRRFASFLHFWRKWFLGNEYRMVQLKSMMADERVNEAIEECARQELQENPKAGTLESLIRKHRQRAERVIINMRAKQARKPYFGYYVRIAAWIIGKTLALIYPKILVQESQIEAIRKAKTLGYPIIYLPVHRSHTDYVLVSWTLVASNMRAPLVAAGENLNIPVFSLMMKSVGGFFIKRRLDRKDGQKDILYRAILQSYMEISLVDDNDLEFFIEGGRTRTGKPCHPKGGLLSIAVDTLLRKKVEDILIIPVNFSYEKLLEGNYIREQLGKAKVKESFASAALGLWNSVQTKFGNARVDYGKPFSVSEYIQSYQNMKSPLTLRALSQESSNSDSECNSRRSSFNTQISGSSACGADIPLDQRDLINNLANHVIYNGVKCFSLMSTSAIAFILLNKYRTGVSMEKLIEEMVELKNELIRRKHSVIYDGEVMDVVEQGLAVLGPALVRRDTVKTTEAGSSTQVVLRPVTLVPNVIDLSYYSTCVLPIYALESVIATSILSLTTGNILSDQLETDMEMVMMEAELVATCLELCEILHHEFIFHPPCQTLVETIRKSMRFMQSEGLLRLQSNSSESEESDEEISSNYHNLIYISNTSDSKNRLVYLKNLVRPILDTYSVSCYALKRLVLCEAQEKQLQMDMLAEVKSQLQQNAIHYGESLALDPIRNFIKVLVGWQVLECFRKDNVSIYYLQDHFDNEKAIDEVIQRVHSGRLFQLEKVKLYVVFVLVAGAGYLRFTENLESKLDAYPFNKSVQRYLLKTNMSAVTEINNDIMLFQGSLAEAPWRGVDLLDYSVNCSAKWRNKYGDVLISKQCQKQPTNLFDMSKRPEILGKPNPDSSTAPQNTSRQPTLPLRNVSSPPGQVVYTTGSSESEQEEVETQARRRNAPYFSWENYSGDRVPANSAEAVKIASNYKNIKYGLTTPQSKDLASQVQNTNVSGENDDWKKEGKGNSPRVFSPYDAENPIVEEKPKKRSDIMDIRQRLKKCFRVVHIVLITSGTLLIIAGCLIKYIDSQMLGKLELSLNDAATKLYIGSGSALIVIAAIAHIILSFKKFKILTWLIYLLILCVAASCSAACSFTSLRSYKNHQVARTKLFDLMSAYNGKQGSATEKWDILQQGYFCCGVDNFMDWTDFPYGRTSLRTPMSCCRNYAKEKDLYCGQNLLPKTDLNEADKYVYAKGCINSMMHTADIWRVQKLQNDFHKCRIRILEECTKFNKQAYNWDSTPANLGPYARSTKVQKIEAQLRADGRLSLRSD